ncbi:MAG: Calx-beta domain-containing protein, partial [Actinomycetota bacterium]
MKRRRTLVACSLIAAGIAAFGVFRASAVPFVNFLSINDVSVIEGDSGTTIAQFTVTLAPTALLETITVHYATADGSARAPGDYAATSGDLTFLPGTSTQTFSVPVVGDVFAEPNEKFFVNLSNPTGASIADGTGEGTVTNDDG